MKKIYFLLSVFIPAILLAQNTPQNLSVSQNAKVNAATNKLVKVDDSYGLAPSGKSGQHESANQSAVPDAVVNPGIIVGTTTYDNQTNASMQRRIIVLPNGQISCIWTMSQTLDDGSLAFPDRGTGYAHFDGTNWSAAPTSRIESIRTGWPAIISIGDTEQIYAHDPASMRIDQTSKPFSGSVWSSQYVTATQPQTGMWPKVASSGDYVYMLTNSQDTGYHDPVSGIAEAMYYSQSSDGGVTWNQNEAELPGQDSTLYYSNGGDDYFIDARDSVVAIVLGGLGKDITLWKSTDYGVHFKRTLVDSVSIQRFDENNHYGVIGVTDTLLSNDGSVSCLIDNNDLVHVFWGGVKIYYDGLFTPNYPFVSPDPLLQLHGWNEQTNQKVVVSYTPDCNGNRILDIGSSYGTNAFPIDYAAQGFINYPQAGIDAGGNIYVTYSALADADTTTLPNAENFPAYAPYRNVYVVYSTDNGNTWSAPIDLTQAPQRECMFPSIARQVDTAAYILYQEDDLPSDYIISSAYSQVDEFNQMKFLAVPISQIFNAGTSELCPDVVTAVNDPKFKAGNLSLYPNPESDGFYFNLANMNLSGQMQLTVTDVSGKIVINKELSELLPGTKISTVGLATGAYIVHLVSNNREYVGKLMIGK
jgi:hypothetical protein